MRLIDNAERRARLAARHGLGQEAPSTGVTDAARRMVGLHSSDPATVFLSAWARIVGGWAQSKDGELRYELFEDVGSEAAEAIESRASALQSWLGDVVVTPRFRSPHEKALSQR